jgi:signal transduction histidine kinase
MENYIQAKVKILHIEDDIADIELLDAYLSDVDNFIYDLTSVHSFEEAGMMLTEKDFSIVIMDLGLIITRGIETYRAFKALKVNLPVLIVTGLDDQDIGMQAINEGAQDYLVKGQFDGNSMVQAIRYALARYQIEIKLKESNKELRRLKNNLERQVANTVKMMLDKDSMLISQSHQVLTGEMVSGIANQWKQPLNSLSMIIQTIKDAYDYDELTPQKMEEKTGLSLELIAYLARTIDDFREYFQPGRQMQIFDLNLLVEKAVSFIEFSFATDMVRLEFEFEDTCTATGYPNEYSQAFLNIINNAREVIVERNVPDADRIVKVRVFEENGKSVLTVEDRAGGISSGELNKIFEPYFTTKQSKGTGVGLYLSKTIIEKNMGGSLTAANSGCGAIFRIEL